MRDKRCGIFCAEKDAVYNLGIEGIPCYFLRKIRIAHVNKPSSNPVKKPFGIKSGNVSAADAKRIIKLL